MLRKKIKIHLYEDSLESIIINLLQAPHIVEYKSMFNYMKVTTKNVNKKRLQRNVYEWLKLRIGD